MGYRSWSKTKLVVAQAALTLGGSALVVGIELAGLSEWLVIVVAVVAAGLVTPLALALARRRN